MARLAIPTDPIDIPKREPGSSKYSPINVSPHGSQIFTKYGQTKIVQQVSFLDEHFRNTQETVSVALWP